MGQEENYETFITNILVGDTYIHKYKVKLLNCEFNVYFSKYALLDNGVYCNLIYKKTIYHKIHTLLNKFLA